MFGHVDQCYVLAFSCIMLNTSLHNPNVQFKPSLRQFIDMNSESAEHPPLPDHTYARIYERCGAGMVARLGLANAALRRRRSGWQRTRPACR